MQSNKVSIFVALHSAPAERKERDLWRTTSNPILSAVKTVRDPVSCCLCCWSFILAAGVIWTLTQHMAAAIVAAVIITVLAFAVGMTLVILHNKRRR